MPRCASDCRRCGSCLAMDSRRAPPLFGFALVRRNYISATLLGAGLAYTAGSFLVAVRTEYRDAHPALVLIVLGAFVLQARNKRVGDETAVGVADHDDLQRRSQ